MAPGATYALAEAASARSRPTVWCMATTVCSGTASRLYENFDPWIFVTEEMRLLKKALLFKFPFKSTASPMSLIRHFTGNHVDSPSFAVLKKITPLTLNNGIEQLDRLIINKLSLYRFIINNT
jgi:hypothetical protein